MLVRHCCAIGLAVLAHAAAANAVIVFLDTGSPPTGVQGGPLDNRNPQLVVLPGRTASLHLWAIPDADDDRVVVSLGHDVLSTGTAAQEVAAVSYTLDNPIIGTNARWNGTNLLGGLNVAGKLVDDQRAVFVPVAQPFVGGIGSSLLSIDPAVDANSGAVWLGELVVQVDADAGVGSTAELRLAVSSLLIASATTQTPAEEPLFFGFDANGPEAASGNGSVVGASSATADATVTVTSFADVDADGNVALDDFAAYVDCRTSPGEASIEANCGVFDAEPDGDIDLADFKQFQIVFAPPAD